MLKDLDHFVKNGVSEVKSVEAQNRYVSWWTIPDSVKFKVLSPIVFKWDVLQHNITEVDLHGNTVQCMVDQSDPVNLFREALPLVLDKISNEVSLEKNKFIGLRESVHKLTMLGRHATQKITLVLNLIHLGTIKMFAMIANIKIVFLLEFLFALVLGTDHRKGSIIYVSDLKDRPIIRSIECICVVTLSWPLGITFNGHIKNV